MERKQNSDLLYKMKHIYLDIWCTCQYHCK